MLLFCIKSILDTFSFDTDIHWFRSFLLLTSFYSDSLLFLLWLLYFVNNAQQLFLLNIFSVLFIRFLVYWTSNNSFSYIIKKSFLFIFIVILIVIFIVIVIVILIFIPIFIFTIISNIAINTSCLINKIKLFY